MSSHWLEKLKQISTIPLRDKLFFVQNLKVMTKTGIPLTKTLATLAEQTDNPRFKRVINEVKNATEKGTSFSSALSNHPLVFDQTFIKMVEAGEASGKLEEVLEQIFLQLKKTHDLRAKIKGALIYPSVILVAMAGIGAAMMILVVPQITSMFSEQKADLPFITQVVINLSHWLTAWWYLILLLLILAGFGFYALKKKPGPKKIMDKIILSLPIFGPIAKKINLAKLTRTFSSLLKTNIPVEKSLIITAQTLNNSYYSQSLASCAAALVKGSSLTEIFKKYPDLFPPLMIQMTAAGEESGSVDELFMELAQFYEEETTETMTTLPNLLEPIIIVLIGAAVAVMAVAILLPMYTITQHI